MANGNLNDLASILKDAIEKGKPVNLNSTLYHVINIHLPGTTPATAANYDQAEIFPYTAGTVVEAWYSYLGEGGTSASVQVRKAESGTAISAVASENITEAMPLTASADTNKSLAMTLTPNTSLVKGDRIGIQNNGTLTGLDDLVVTLKVKVTSV